MCRVYTFLGGISFRDTFLYDLKQETSIKNNNRSNVVSGIHDSSGEEKDGLSITFKRENKTLWFNVLMT